HKKDDFDNVMRRAAAWSVSSIIVTAGDLADARKALKLCREQSGKHAGVKLYTTVGVHPTSTKQLERVAHGGHGHSHGHGHGHGHSSTETHNVAHGDSVAAGAGDACGCDAKAHRGEHHDGLLTREEYIAALDALLAEGVADGSVVAVGECGLDYDRLHFSPKDVQLRNFEFHFDLAAKYRLPMFLHDRNTGGDFAGTFAFTARACTRVHARAQLTWAYTMRSLHSRVLGAQLTRRAVCVRTARGAAEFIRRNRERIVGGVVHSFTGSAEEARTLLDAGLYIGINGCSLKTEANLDVVRGLPLDRIMLETGACCPRACCYTRTARAPRFVEQQDAMRAHLALCRCAVVRDPQVACVVPTHTHALQEREEGKVRGRG
ncbi:hypothetical protein EON67_02200, partial [archaeon]